MSDGKCVLELKLLNLSILLANRCSARSVRQYKSFWRVFELYLARIKGMKNRGFHWKPIQFKEIMLFDNSKSQIDIQHAGIVISRAKIPVEKKVNGVEGHRAG